MRVKPSVVSLGAGVQSTVLLLRAARGDFGPVPELAIFADTQWEPRAVYEHLDWLIDEVGDRVEVVKVTAGDFRAASLEVRTSKKSGKRYLRHTPPAYSLDAENGEGMLMRQCTRDFKIKPIYRELAARGLKPCRMLLGISIDEVERMKPAADEEVENTYPLVEAKITRAACRTWFAEHYPGRLLPRSACIGCPYHDRREWRDLRDNSPEEWADAIAYERELNGAVAQAESTFRASEGVFLHRQRVPLDQVDLSTPEDRGQGVLFADECEGMCGV
jgi:hypothetical protein